MHFCNSQLINDVPINVKDIYIYIYIYIYTYVCVCVCVCHNSQHYQSYKNFIDSIIVTLYLSICIKFEHSLSSFIALKVI